MPQDLSVTPLQIIGHKAIGMLQKLSSENIPFPCNSISGIGLVSQAAYQTKPSQINSFFLRKTIFFN